MDMIVPLLDKGADARLSLHRLYVGSWLDPVSLPMIDGPLEPSIDINDRDRNGCPAMHYMLRHLYAPHAAIRWTMLRGMMQTRTRHPHSFGILHFENRINGLKSPWSWRLSGAAECFGTDPGAATQRAHHGRSTQTADGRHQSEETYKVQEA